MTVEYDINVDWTLKALKEAKSKNKHRTDTCFSCGNENMQVKDYKIAVLNRKLQWSDGTGGVYEKIKAQYCDECVDALVKSLEESEEVTN